MSLEPKKKNPEAAPESAAPEVPPLSPPCCPSWPRGGRCPGKIVFLAVIILTLGAMAAWFGAKARNEYRQYDFIGRPVPVRDVISVSGEGKAQGVPDVALVDLGMTSEKATVSDAQQDNTKVMNNLLMAITALGIDKKDVQTTSYSVSPAYDWTDGKQTLRGYTVSQMLHVKVRNLDVVSTLLGKAGELGANQVGGISFTIDEPDKLRDEARTKAIAAAQAKAATLAAQLGVALGRVVSYADSGTPSQPQPIMFDKAAMGVGGGEAIAPNVEPGTNEIVTDVTVTYEIR